MTQNKGSILFINRVFPPDSGASALRLFELAQALAETGWRITILTNKGRNIAPQNLHANIKLIRLPYGAVDRKPTMWQYPLWLLAFWVRALSLPSADITITLSDPPLAALISALLKPFKKTRIIHWVHDVYPQLLTVTRWRKPLLQPFFEALAAWAMRRHEAVITLGEDMSAVLHDMGVPESKLHVIPNWPDVEGMLRDKNKPLRHSSGNPFVLEGVFTVLYSGNFGPAHDFTTLIEAINIIHKTQHPIRFILAGDGSKFEDVRQAVDALFLTNVHFIRAQPKEKFMDLLQAGDVHVSTTVPEALGLASPSKINSALGLGRPCLFIGAPQAFQAKLITQHHAGLVVDPTDSQARFLLAEMIIQLATNHAAYEQMQENALHAAESISFAKSFSAFETLLAG